MCDRLHYIYPVRKAGFTLANYSLRICTGFVTSVHNHEIIGGAPNKLLFVDPEEGVQAEVYTRNVGIQMGVITRSWNMLI